MNILKIGDLLTPNSKSSYFDDYELLQITNIDMYESVTLKIISFKTPKIILEKDLGSEYKVDYSICEKRYDFISSNIVTANEMIKIMKI